MADTPDQSLVTPARKIGDPQPSRSEDRPTHRGRPRGTSFARPLVISLLYLGGFVTLFSPIIGIVLAYIWRGEDTAAEWENTHFTYLIVTFWVGFLLNIVIMIAFFATVFGLIMEVDAGPSSEPPLTSIVVFLGVAAVWGLAALWFCVRCIISMAKASSLKPMPRPRTWLF